MPKYNGAQVQRAGRFRHRIAAAIDQRSHHIGHLHQVRLGQRQQAGALQQALHVPVHAKHVHGAIGLAEGLEPFEARTGIVQRVRRRAISTGPRA